MNEEEKQCVKKAENWRTDVAGSCIRSWILSWTSMGCRRASRKKTGNHPTAFLEISGHVAWVEVQIHRTGYADGISADLHLTSPFDVDMPLYETPMSEMIEVLKREKARRRQPDRAQEN